MIVNSSPYCLKISNFRAGVGWSGDISSADRRALYKFLQRKYRQIRSNLFLWRRNMAILWISCYLLSQGSRTFPSILSIMCSAKKKKSIPSSIMVAFKCVFSKRYFLLCLHSNISWNKYEVAYELAFLAQVTESTYGSYQVSGRILWKY